MKSIMEQASSIIKAIEKAWISADKPKEFSIKIFEIEEKNFFGMTTKPAKIGIFFEDKVATSHEKPAIKASSFAPLTPRLQRTGKAIEDGSKDEQPKQPQPKKPFSQTKSQPRAEQSKP